MDGEKQMNESTLHLKEMMDSKLQKAAVIAVTSGKGGVGKTNLSTNLGICMAAAQKEVLLVDADMSLGNLDVLLNIQNKYNISHLVNGKKEIEEIIQPGPNGLKIICGASGLQELAELGEFQRQRLIQELSKMQNENDVLIIDTGAGISSSVIGFCLCADHVLVVTTPEATAMTDAYAAIKVITHHKYHGKISLVVNMADSIVDGKKTYKQISNVAKKFLNINIFEGGILLRDDRMLQAVRLRKPVVLAFPKAKITASLATIAARIGHHSNRNANDQSFLKKVVDWFF